WLPVALGHGRSRERTASLPRRTRQHRPRRDRQPPHPSRRSPNQEGRFRRFAAGYSLEPRRRGRATAEYLRNSVPRAASRPPRPHTATAAASALTGVLRPTFRARGGNGEGKSAGASAPDNDQDRHLADRDRGPTAT